MGFDPSATVEYEYVATFENEYVEMAYNCAKVLVGISPMILLGVIIFQSFDEPEEEQKRREHECTKKCC